MGDPWHLNLPWISPTSSLDDLYLAYCYFHLNTYRSQVLRVTLCFSDFAQQPGYDTPSFDFNTIEPRPFRLPKWRPSTAWPAPPAKPSSAAMIPTRNPSRAPKAIPPRVNPMTPET